MTTLPSGSTSGDRPGNLSRADRTWLVALAASMWGVSSVLREPLAQRLPALTIVLLEHVALVCMLSPWVLPALRALRAASAPTKAGMVVIGAGSSALATTMFTAAFALGDPITPQVLQKLQPVIALVLASVLLGERLTARFAFFAVPALAGAWLLAFPHPLGMTVTSTQAAALAVGAAALWAAGTVLGRMVSRELSFMHVTTLRFSMGLVTLAGAAAISGVPVTMPPELIPQLILLALVPGLLALVLYYIGLRATPASRATFAELAFPLSAAVVGVTVLDGHLDGTQWLGFWIMLISVVVLAIHEHNSRHPAVTTPDRIEDAIPRTRRT